MSDVVEGFKCVECGSLFPQDAILKHAARVKKDPAFLDCPVCGVKFTDGMLGQRFHGHHNPPSIREVYWPVVYTANPDDR